MGISRVLPLLLAAGCAQTTPRPATAPAPALQAAVALTAPAPASARTTDFTETRFGVQVSDPYRWMEGNENAETTAWLRAEGERTDAWLARIPARKALFERIRELGLSTSSSGGLQLAGGRVFYTRIGAGEQLPKLMVRDADGTDRVLVDPATIGKDGSHASVNAFAPSPDGSLMAYDLALGGGEVSSIRIIDVASGKELSDVIERVWGEFAASWLPDNSGFLYTQMAPPAKDTDPLLNMRVRLHLLGRPVADDPMIIDRGAAAPFALAPEEFPAVAIDPQSRWMMAIVGGAHNEIRVAVAPLLALDRSGAGKTPWQTVAGYEDSVELASPHGDRLYLQTFKDASNRKLISVPLNLPDLRTARVELPESSEATIVRFAVARDALYVESMVNGLARLHRMPLGGALETVALPYEGWIDELVTDPSRVGATIDIQGWTRPAAFYAYDPAARALKPNGMRAESIADFSNVVAEEVEATSSDGTKVPLSILRRRDLALDGSHPAIVYGYGGYGYSMTPWFSPTRLAWLERGGIFTVCHVRGGGEKGYQWQVTGTHEHKMNGIHDFEACAQYLIDQRLTTASRVAVQGGSMGGVLAGRAITERPDLFAAANVAVGIVNPVRILAAENGANQKTELGDPETEVGFKSIYEMDPYQHVQAGTKYPAVIFTVGLNDRRVAPWMTAKMAARMQAATASGKPVLVRIESDAGHGVGSTRDQAYAESADVWAFFLAASGDPEFQAR